MEIRETRLRARCFLANDPPHAGFRKPLSPTAITGKVKYSHLYCLIKALQEGMIEGS